MYAYLPPEAEVRRRRAHALLHAALVLALLVTACAHGLRRPGPDPLPPPLAIDLAHDPAWRLGLLPGIGPQRAQALVEQRARAGTPRRRADLLAVPGIGPLGVKRLASAAGVEVLLDGRPLARVR